MVLLWSSDLVVSCAGVVAEGRVGDYGHSLLHKLSEGTPQKIHTNEIMNNQMSL
jgi:hypothetical protein